VKTRERNHDKKKEEKKVLWKLRKRGTCAMEICKFGGVSQRESKPERKGTKKTKFVGGNVNKESTRKRGGAVFFGEKKQHTKGGGEKTESKEEGYISIARAKNLGWGVNFESKTTARVRKTTT